MERRFFHAAAGLFLLAVAFQIGAQGSKAQGEREREVISARRFDVVDAEGRVVATLGSVKNRGGRLRIFNTQGRFVVTAMAGRGGGYVSTLADTSMSGASLSQNTIAIRDSYGHPVVELRGEPQGGVLAVYPGGPALHLYPQAWVGITEGGEGAVEVSGLDRQARVFKP